MILLCYSLSMLQWKMLWTLNLQLCPVPFQTVCNLLHMIATTHLTFMQLLIVTLAVLTQVTVHLSLLVRLNYCTCQSHIYTTDIFTGVVGGIVVGVVAVVSILVVVGSIIIVWLYISLKKRPKLEIGQSPTGMVSVNNNYLSSHYVLF